MMDKDLLGKNAPTRRLRRSYSIAVFGAPWLLSAAGLALVVFGLLADRPAVIQATAMTTGSIMAIIGLLLLRVSGPLELTPKGIKGNIDAIPTDALFIARDAAQMAIPSSYDPIPSGYDAQAANARADQAAFQALQTFGLIQTVTGIIDLDAFSRRALQYLAANDRERYMQALTELLDKHAKEAEGDDEDYVRLLKLIRSVQYEAQLTPGTVTPENIETIKRRKELELQNLLSLEGLFRDRERTEAPIVEAEIEPDEMDGVG